MKKKKRSSFAGKTTSNAKKQNQGSNYGYLKLPKGVNVFKEEPGRTTLDILPYEVTISNHPDLDMDEEIAVKGSLWYKLPFKVHRNVGPNNDSVVCPRSFGKKCPICDYREKRLKEGAEKEETDGMRPSQRNLYAVMVISSKEERKVKVWDISQFLFQNLLNAELEEDEDYGRFPDLEDGLSLKIRFDSQSIGKNKFAEASRIDFVDRKQQYTEDILDKIPSLDEMLTIYSYDQLQSMFFELEDPVDDDAEDDDDPPVRKRKVKAAPEPDDDEDMEDEDDDMEDDDEDDDEPEKPVRKRKPKPEPEDEKPVRKRKPKPEPEPDDDEDMEDEDDDMEDDDEDDDEPPVRKNKSTSKPKAKEESKAKKHSGKDSKERCPFGHKFGVDCEEYDDCESCELWDECLDEKESR